MDEEKKLVSIQINIDVIKAPVISIIDSLTSSGMLSLSSSDIKLTVLVQLGQSLWILM
jgi:hypothetical protein